MTFREKFKSVFGVEFEHFDERDLDLPYGKLKLYKITMYSRKWRGNSYSGNEYSKPLYEVYITAKDEREARKKGVLILGDKYELYQNTIKVARCKAECCINNVVNCREAELPIFKNLCDINDFGFLAWLRGK